MSSPPPAPDVERLRRRVLAIYDTVTVLMLIGIAVLIVYSIELGSLTSPGAQESFGLAVALMFLMSALVFHLVDRTYRAWPLGRRIHPTPPGPVTAASQTRFLKILVVAIAAAAIAYVLGGLIA